MHKPRCGVPDVSEHETQRSKVKWPKTNLTWNFHLADKATLATTRSAFDIWKANSLLFASFERNTWNPNILISWREGRHTYANPRSGLCLHDLDGPSSMLANLTRCRDTVSEIHVDRSRGTYTCLRILRTNCIFYSR